MDMQGFGAEFLGVEPRTVNKLEMVAISLLAENLLKASEGVGDKEIAEGVELDLESMAMDFVVTMDNSNEPSHTDKEKNTLKAMKGQLAVRISESSARFKSSKKNVLIRDYARIPYDFLSHLITTATDSFEVIEDRFDEDDTKVRGFNHYMKARVVFNGAVYIMEVIDVNRNGKATPGFNVRKPIQCRVVCDGRVLGKFEDEMVIRSFVLVMMGYRIDSNHRRDTAIFQNNEMLVEKSKQVQAIMGGNYIDYIVLVEGLSSVNLYAQEEMIGVDAIALAIMTIVGRHLVADKKKTKAVAQIFLDEVKLFDEINKNSVYH